MTSLLGITEAATVVHDVLGVALDQRHERGDAVEDGALLGGGQHRQQPGAVARPRTTLTSSPTAPDRRRRSSAGSVSMVALSASTSSSMCWRSHGTAVNCTRCVTSCRHTHSRKSCGSTLSWRSTATRFGRDEQQLAAGPVEELELAEHLARQEAEDDADLHAGEPAADPLGHLADRVVGGEARRRAGP